jgi:RNA polymerase primary sigma factor
MAGELDLHWYLEEIRKFPLLTAQQEQDLARKIRQHGDVASRQEMIRCNLRLVVSIARRYMRRGVSLIDLVAEGNIGLVRAVDLFDPDKEVRFSTYATWWVRQAIRKALMLHARPIRLPAYLSQRIARLQGETSNSRNDNGEAITDADIATRMNLSASMVAAARKASRTMHAATCSENSDENGLSVHELLEDVRTPAPEAAVEHNELAHVIEITLTHLEPREAFILRLHNGIGVNGTFTLDQIASRLGVTRERVRQIEVSALKKLSHLLQGQEYLLERTARHISNGARQTVLV